MAMSTINPFYVIIIFMILMCMIDDVYTYFIIEILLVIMYRNKTDIFSDIPTALTTWLDLVFLSLLIVAFVKHIYIILKARKKYNSIIGD